MRPAPHRAPPLLAHRSRDALKIRRRQYFEEARYNERFSYSSSNVCRNESLDDEWIKADLLAGLDQSQSLPAQHEDPEVAMKAAAAAAAAEAAQAAAAAEAAAAAAAAAAAEIEDQKLRLQSSMARSLSRLDRVFAAADSDGNGSFDRTEFRGLVAMLGLAASEAACDALFAQYDTDGSGSISFTEFLVGQLRAYLARAARRLMDVFREFDVDKSRTVDREEFVNGVYAMGLKVQRRHVAALFDSIDEDRSGKLEFKELHAALKGDSNGVELQSKNRISIRELRERRAQRKAEGITTPLPSPRGPPPPPPPESATAAAHLPQHRHRPSTEAPRHRAPPPPPPPPPSQTRLGPGVVSFADFKRSGRRRDATRSSSAPMIKDAPAAGIGGGTAPRVLDSAATTALSRPWQQQHMSKLLRTELDRLVFRGA